MWFQYVLVKHVENFEPQIMTHDHILADYDVDGFGYICTSVQKKSTVIHYHHHLIIKSALSNISLFRSKQLLVHISKVIDLVTNVGI